MNEHAQVASIRSGATVLEGTDADYDDLVERAGRCRIVMLGEATHGTDEFYRMRAAISRRLIAERQFDAVAVEGDWPDCYRVNRYVRSGGADGNAAGSLGDFERFPRWMWRNTAVVAFVDWLATHNASRPKAERAGFYGLDMYSLYRSADAVIDYLGTVDSEQAEIARRQYAALDHVRDPQRYGYEAVRGLRPDCGEAVRQRLAELVRREGEYKAAGAPDSEDAYFFAERNAHVVANAESYYRAMFGPRALSWNMRDAHMAQTLMALQKHLRSQGRAGRVLVWAHNSHVGDARSTEMSLGGEYNLGQLMRLMPTAGPVCLVGFTTYTGTVRAAWEWGGEAESRRVNEAVEGSYEHLFYRSGLEAFYLPFERDAAAQLDGPLLERAIGVLYLPDTEMQSHYLYSRMPRQFDAVFHLDETHAVEPLD
ncbi:erythromycin esterase family protein [Luteibacter yeojuensis]|uniref:Erythromycin esterase family protein n=1 Tax=Luteibacter yeojuensis TaxID=345309 RepID=A0A7X5TPM4_9GAMM|nr:erythromycin esterase family protein [Luteibacter yeojuensis]NID14627.1 erythromycin esterase family protein [Luteibacter yeojuensis]